MHPRMLVTVDEAMKELSVNVRVGQAVCAHCAARRCVSAALTSARAT